MAATSLSTPERFVLMQCLAVCYGVLQCVSVSRVTHYKGVMPARRPPCGSCCRSVLQCVAACCNALQRVAAGCSVECSWRCVPASCQHSVLQCVAVCCSVVLQRIVVYRSVLCSVLCSVVQCVLLFA